MSQTDVLASIWWADFTFYSYHSVQSGLGLSFLTFDWGVISTLGNPLAVSLPRLVKRTAPDTRLIRSFQMPWWSAANMSFGFGLVCVLYTTTYYSGAFSSWYLPFSGSSTVRLLSAASLRLPLLTLLIPRLVCALQYDNMAQTYNFSRILTSEATLNRT